MIFKFVFVGRICKEKWVLHMIRVFEKIMFDKKFTISLDIFWQSWDAINPLLKFASTYPDQINYHWFKDKSIIYKYRANCHFVLMPSIFLETFGLSCLDAYAHWKPVIWFDKWWLSDLLIDRYKVPYHFWMFDIDSEIDSLYNTCIKSINNFNISDYDSDVLRCKKIYNNHSQVNWIKLFIERISSLYKVHIWWQKSVDVFSKNILFISDYTVRFWWIESLVDDMILALWSSWFIVNQWISPINKNFMRSAWFILSFFNIFAALSLFYKVNKNNNDILFFHSILRFIWWLPLFVLWFHPSKKVLMIHDLWLMHPYPSLVVNEEQLIFARNLTNYLQAGYACQKTWLFANITMIWKYILSSLIRLVLKKNIDIYFVPSSFMVIHIQRWLWTWNHVINVIPHFVKKH